MANLVPRITLSLPESLLRRMKRHPEIGWSDVIRRILEEKVRDLDATEGTTAESTLTRADVDELDHRLKGGLSRRYRGARP